MQIIHQETCYGQAQAIRLLETCYGSAHESKEQGSPNCRKCSLEQETCYDQAQVTRIAHETCYS